MHFVEGVTFRELFSWEVKLIDMSVYLLEFSEK